MNTERVIRTLQQGMTVSDLIEELKNQEEDAIVVFGCDYGDHCHTTQALPVQTVTHLSDGDEVGNAQRIEESGYSQSGLSVQCFHGDHDEGETLKDWEHKEPELNNVVILC